MPRANRRRLFGALMLIVAAGVLAGCGGGKSSTNVHYTDAKLRYGFDYPKGWNDVTAKVKLATGKSTANLVGHIALGSFDDKLGLFTGVQVTVVQTNQQVNGDNMDSVLADLDGLFQQFSSSVAGRQSDPQAGELGGLKARQYVVQFVYHSGARDEQIATAQTVTFFGDREYTVNCQGLADNFDSDIRPGCELALQSFRFS